MTQADSGSLTIFPNYMFKDSYVTALIFCESKHDVQVNVTWYLQQLHCMDEMYNAQAKAQQQLFQSLYPSAKNTNGTCPTDWQLVTTTVYQTSTYPYQCSENKLLTLKDESFLPRQKSYVF